MEKEKSCKNCRYYLVHYVKTSQGYMDTSCGHCTETWRNPPKGNICDKWERIENVVPELEISLKSRLESLEKSIEKLYCVADLLKDIYCKQ